jgi:hypothetical protein
MLGLKWALGGKRPATNHLSHGTGVVTFRQVCGKTDDKNHSTFNRTQSLIYTVSALQHVTAHRAIIMLSRTEKSP